MADKSPKQSPSKLKVHEVSPKQLEAKKHSETKVEKQQKVLLEGKGRETRRSERAQLKEVEQKQEDKKGNKATKKDEPKVLKKHQKIAEAHDIQQLQDIAHQLRIHSIEMTNASNSGHPTSCCSMAELMAVLFMDPSGIHYDPKNPRSFTSDRFVLSKGHAAPILYAAWALAGFIDPHTLINLRKFDSDLEGHPTPRLPFVDIATGSLGQGVSVAGGMAYTSKYLDKLDNRYWCLMGDGESAEGSIWEACSLASHYKLDNLTLIIDVNRLGQSQETMHQHEMDIYRNRFESFGFAVFKVDGHNILELIEIFEKCRNTKGRPQVIIARTQKGMYLENIQNSLDWHGKPLGNKSVQAIQLLQSLQKTKQFTLAPQLPQHPETPYPELPVLVLTQPTYAKGTKFSSRKAYGNALVNLSHSDAYHQLVSLDGDVKNSTFSLTYKEAVPNNFVECFIAEQNMVGWAQGVACRNKVAFVSTFGAFFARAYDQIRMGGISRSQVNYVGSHCGVSIGEDGYTIINIQIGPSQMALEDLALFRAIPDCLVLYPSDAVSTERAVELAANYGGSTYIRTSRPETEVLYENTELFNIGQSKVLIESNLDELVLVGAGVTLHEALSAQKALALEGVYVSVVDLFCVKPIDRGTLLRLVKNSNRNIILTIEDHYLQGGIYEAVSGAVADQENVKVFGIGVTHIPRSGTPSELMQHYRLDSISIQQKVRQLIQ